MYFYGDRMIYDWSLRIQSQGRHLMPFYILMVAKSIEQGCNFDQIYSSIPISWPQYNEDIYQQIDVGSYLSSKDMYRAV